MIVRIKTVHPDAHVPKYAKPGDAGMDLHATDFATDDHGSYVYHAGFLLRFPKGMWGIFRSSVSRPDFR